VNQLLNYILESRCEQSFNGFTIIYDLGYSKMALVKHILHHDIGVILAMPDHLIACHPFVGKSYVKLWRNENDEESADNGEEGATSNVSEYYVQTGESQVESFSISQVDSPRAFVLDDDLSMERASFIAQNLFRGERSLKDANTAAAIQERGTQKFSKILRFMYRLSPSVSRMMEKWLAVPGSGTVVEQLFSLDRITMVGSSLQVRTQWNVGENVGRNILSNCVFISVGQRCADWFVLRQFRVTDTNAGNTLLGNEAFEMESDKPLWSIYLWSKRQKMPSYHLKNV
jgi:hypothetical protein